MIYFYATVVIVGSVGQRNYNYLVKAKNIDDARELIETEIDFLSSNLSSIHISVSKIGSMVEDNSVRRIYLDSKG